MSNTTTVDKITKLERVHQLLLLAYDMLWEEGESEIASTVLNAMDEVNDEIGDLEANFSTELDN